MTRIEKAELETDLEEIDAAIDEYACALVELTDKPRAAALLLGALNSASSHAGRIRYQLKLAEKENDA